MKYRIDLSYDGTEYGGWALQPNRVSIQELIEKALGTVLRNKTPITGSGRTDAGVHARQQVAHFSHPDSLDLRALTYSLNGILPRDIRITSITSVSETFHARFSVEKKIYHYYCTESHNPFNYRYSHPLHHPLDLDLIRKAIPLLLGTHDFSAFASSGCGSKDPVKTLYRLDLIEEKGAFRFEFEGDGFLYKMVRNITGTLLEIGAGKRSPDDISRILLSRDRKEAGATAPAKGLFLHAVKYSH
ncbi:MAG: tRNA pseudouridine(38-40) synthase TruA [Chlamydiales bacterium]|nr:tRNA pseudouridine(38-40) synthase TruA [Chlamydiales bacterium]